MSALYTIYDIGERNKVSVYSPACMCVVEEL